MLIDWVTCRVPVEFMTQEARDKAYLLGDRIARYCPRTGAVRYETSSWDSIRSDSHQISVKYGGSGFTICGSPARVTGDGCAVFGSGASARLSLGGCVDAMRLFVQSMTDIDLPPDLGAWIVTRVDVTGNLCLSSLSEVRDSLRVLRDCEGGRYRVSQQSGDSVYWSDGSRLRSGKAYAKGPHLRYLMKRRDYTGRQYSEDEIFSADVLLRLELCLGREFWARNDWRTVDGFFLIEQWNDYFSRMIGDAEMKSDDDLKQRIFEVAPSEGRGRSAYGCWLLIQAEGWERARESFTKSTWYNHLKVLRDAGLGDADISAGTVVPLRRRVFEARMVNTWADLKAA